MEPVADAVQQIAGQCRHISRQLITIGANRLELLSVELQEERHLLVRAVLLAFAAACFGLLAGGTLTALVAVLFFDRFPVLVLCGLSLAHGTAAVLVIQRLRSLLGARQSLSASFDQLRKDCACLKSLLE